MTRRLVGWCLAACVVRCSSGTNATRPLLERWRPRGEAAEGRDPTHAANATRPQRLRRLHRDETSAGELPSLADFATELAALRAGADACADPALGGGSSGCVHQNNGLQCTPRGAACARPCGALSVKLYGAAGATLREGVLMHLWGRRVFFLDDRRRGRPFGLRARPSSVHAVLFAVDALVVPHSRARARCGSTAPSRRPAAPAATRRAVAPRHARRSSRAARSPTHGGAPRPPSTRDAARGS